MALQALNLSPELLSAAGFLVSVHSFAGDIEEASKQFETLKQFYSPLSLSCQQVEAIRKYATEQSEPEPGSGVIGPDYWSYKSSGGFSRLCNIPLITKEQASVVTTSIFGPKTVEVRPWDVLINIDRRFPHVMVQQQKDFQIIHAFIAVSRATSWPWQEVPLIVRSNERVLDNNVFRWILPMIHPNSISTLVNSLFEQVEREIKTANLLEDL
jgi:hypothetical protein